MLVHLTIAFKIVVLFRQNSVYFNIGHLSVIFHIMKIAIGLPVQVL